MATLTGLQSLCALDEIFIAGKMTELSLAGLANLRKLIFKWSGEDTTASYIADARGCHLTRLDALQ